jgi:transposase-like protein
MGRVTDEQQPARPKRRTFTKAYKGRILAAFDALLEGSPERGALLRKERLYHSHIVHWRKQAGHGTLAASNGRPEKSAESEELARLLTEKCQEDMCNVAKSGGSSSTSGGRSYCCRKAMRPASG